MTIDELLAKVGQVEQATLAKSLPSAAEDYRFEIKYDGFRILALKSAGEVRLYTRNGKDWTDAFPTVAAAVSELSPGELALDGEVCGLDEQGRSSFLEMKGGSSTAYVVFDVLWVDGVDQRTQSLEARREVVERLLRSAPAPLTTATIVEVNDVAAAMERAREQRLEGLIAKRRGSPYTPGRSRDWLKLKCTMRQEFALAGYVPLVRTTDRVGALLLAIHDGRRFVYAGKVGTGFDNATRLELASALDQYRVEQPTADGMPKIRDAHFATPTLVGEVSFMEWTPDGKIRHPSFLGLRPDKSAEECKREF